MTLHLDIGGLPREIQIPFEQIQREHPWGPEDLRNGSVGPAALQTSPTVVSASADLTLSTTVTDISGATFTTTLPGVYEIHGTFDFDHTAAGGSLALGWCAINGVDQGEVATLAEGAVRGTCTQVWVSASLAAGTIIKLRASKTVAAGTVVAHGGASPHTRLLVVGPF